MAASTGGYLDKNTLLVHEHSVKKVTRLLRNYDEQKLRQSRTRDEKELFELGTKIRPISLTNWQLEKDIQNMDAEIESLIKSKLNSNTSGQKNTEATESRASPFAGDKQPHFEQMFSLLLHEPRYLAVLSHKVCLKEIDDFVKLVLVDLFGGRPEFEASMLQMFSQSMELEFENCKKSNDFGALYRNKSAAIRCLKEYALQGDGKEVLNDMIREPVSSLCQHNADLEINTNNMYKQFVREFEQQTGKPWPHQREGLTELEIFEKPFIKKLYEPRVEQLQYVIEHFLMSVIKHTDKLNWGVRWICKKLNELSKKHFPQTSPYQRGGVVGGFIFLRLINPRINIPNSFGVVEQRPQKHTLRTLAISSKILQKLSNGTEFRETHYQCLNPFLREKRELFQSFIAKITNVSGLEFQLDMYNLLKYKRERPVTVQTTYNQILVIHRLLVKHIDECCPKMDDPMRDVLQALGTPIPMKENYRRVDNHTTTLHLSLPSSATSSIETQAEKYEAVSNLVSSSNDRPKEIADAFSVLIDFCKQIDLSEQNETVSRSHDFLQFLQTVVQQDIGELSQLAQDCVNKVNNAVEFLNKNGEEEDYTPSQFLIQYTEQIRVHKKRLKQLTKHVRNVERAYRAIRKHNKFLIEKRDSYQVYFSQVSSNENAQTMNTTTNQTVKLSHSEMEAKGLIFFIAPEHKKNAERLLTYVFRQVGPGEFELNAVAKKYFVSMNVMDEPLNITIRELTNLQTRYQDEFVVDSGVLSLNVNLLKMFLEGEFSGGKATN